MFVLGGGALEVRIGFRILRSRSGCVRPGSMAADGTVEC